MGLGKLAVAFVLAGSPAVAHEVYSDWYSGGEKGVGRWCCSGNLEGTRGDCAPASYTMMSDGSAVMVSRRYPGRPIHVARDRILWMQIPGGEAYEAHICALQRLPGNPPTPEDPDPDFTVICAAIAPGGV